ncbi:MAG TPA: hypothetical protein VGG24_04160, partial [Paraburkholderia sp.]
GEPREAQATRDGVVIDRRGVGCEQGNEEIGSHEFVLAFASRSGLIDGNSSDRVVELQHRRNIGATKKHRAKIACRCNRR